MEKLKNSMQVNRPCKTLKSILNSSQGNKAFKEIFKNTNLELKDFLERVKNGTSTIQENKIVFNLLSGQKEIYKKIKNILKSISNATKNENLLKDNENLLKDMEKLLTQTNFINYFLKIKGIKNINILKKDKNGKVISGEVENEKGHCIPFWMDNYAGEYRILKIEGIKITGTHALKRKEGGTVISGIVYDKKGNGISFLMDDYTGEYKIKQED